MDEGIVEQAVLELVNGPSRLCRQLFEPDPDQESTTEVMMLKARLTTRATFKPGEWFAFAVPLLNLPTKATRLWGGLRSILRAIVGYDPIRAGGGPP
jgi:hypothetical protein